MIKIFGMIFLYLLSGIIGLALIVGVVFAFSWFITYHFIDFIIVCNIILLIIFIVAVFIVMANIIFAFFYKLFNRIKG